MCNIYTELVGLFHWFCLEMKIIMRSTNFRCEESTSQRKERIDRQLYGLRIGDLICIEQSLFVHYVVYMGNDNVVGNVKSGIVYQDLYEKVGRNDCYISNYLDDMYSHFPSNVITDRAKQFAKEREMCYDMLYFNCEHFATLCRYGIPCCRQPCWMDVFVTVFSFVLDVYTTTAKILLNKC